MTLVPNTHRYRNAARKMLVANDDFFFPAAGLTRMYSELLLTIDPTMS